MIAGGVDFAILPTEDACRFQKNILRMILVAEETYGALAEYYATVLGQPTVILCDRGTLDASACREASQRLIG